MNPRILIPIPTSFDPPYNQQCWPEYANAVKSCGAEPVAVSLSSSESELREMLATANGILLPGSGADVAPSRYGHQLAPETAPSDAARERIDDLLLQAVESQQLPLLAVCFGLQSLNVFRGGTLVQHLQPMPVNHRAGRAVSDAHASLVASSSQLGGILESASGVSVDEQEGYLRLMVNSSHHQAIGVPGDNLRVVARSTEDGVIEAVEDTAFPFLLGVQWHPERTLEHSAASRAIVSAFVAAAERHA